MKTLRKTTAVLILATLTAYGAFAQAQKPGEIPNRGLLGPLMEDFAKKHGIKEAEKQFEIKDATEAGLLFLAFVDAADSDASCVISVVYLEASKQDWISRKYKITLKS